MHSSLPPQSLSLPKDVSCSCCCYKEPSQPSSSVSNVQHWSYLHRCHRCVGRCVAYTAHYKLQFVTITTFISHYSVYLALFDLHFAYQQCDRLTLYRLEYFEERQQTVFSTDCQLKLCKVSNDRTIFRLSVSHSLTMAGCHIQFIHEINV